VIVGMRSVRSKGNRIEEKEGDNGMAGRHGETLMELHEKIEMRGKRGERSGFLGVIRAEEAESYCRANGIGIDEFMLLLVPVAQGYALTPISDFAVGAVVLGESGNLYLGANAEFRELGLHASVHAEQAAVNSVLVSGYEEAELKALAVSAAPCGHCRQYLNEIEGVYGLRVVIQQATSGWVVRTSLRELLPLAFGPGDLKISESLLRRGDNKMVMREDGQDEVIRAALVAANGGYAPYTRSYAGMALQVEDGGIFVGVISENAAYNPSLSPMQSAVSHMRMWDEGFAGIRRAVLVEVEGAICSQVVNASGILGVVAPGVELEVYGAMVGL
jgi:cytidine deaminase